MTEQITDDILDRFQLITKYDVGQFLKNYIIFTESDYPTIVNYYNGASDILPKDSFYSLSSLIKEQKKVIDISILNASSLTNYQFWALMEYIEDIGSALETANNASRWLRSSLSKNGYNQSVSLDLTLNQNQGLEQLERDNLKSNDADGWVDTALQNELREEDYDLSGGYLIKVIFKNNASIFLNSVVDNINTAEKTYGRDINRTVKIDPTTSDLEILDYYETMIQSATILGGLKKGDDPAFNDRGLDAKNIVGGNLAGISYPTIFRQIAGNFATDDSFKSFTIIDVKRDKDAVFVEYQVETRAGEVKSDIIPI